MDNGVKLDVRDKVAYVTLDRQERRNALSVAAIEGLIDAFSRFDVDDDVWAVLITGAGQEAFCAGRDLKELANLMDQEKPTGHPMRQRLRNPFEVIYECRKPVVAALNGWTVGGGFELAMACDVRIAASHVRLSMPEALRGMGANFGAAMLPRLIPHAVAYDMLYTGRVVSADEAARWGLVNAVVPAADLASAGDAYARTLVSRAPLTLRRYKAMVRHGSALPLPAALRLDLQPDPYTSQDRVEGAHAFAEKREPRWQAR
jgi:enoyl-CoA hydratase